MFGAGVGAGDAYRVSTIQFDNEKSAAAAK